MRREICGFIHWILYKHRCVQKMRRCVPLHIFPHDISFNCLPFHKELRLSYIFEKMRSSSIYEKIRASSFLLNLGSLLSKKV
jgi:hypothetical protein